MPTPCRHKRMRSIVLFLYEKERPASAVISISCHQCGHPFQFIGVESSPSLLLSDDRKTLQLIIAPEDIPDGTLAWKIEHAQHRLVRDASGRVDMLAYADIEDTTGKSHHGPRCEICRKVWCEECSQNEPILPCCPDDEEGSLLDDLEGDDPDEDSV